MSHQESQPTPGRKDQIRAQQWMRRVVGTAIIATALAAESMTTGADLIDPQASAPKPDYIIGSSGPHLSVTEVAPGIPAEVADRIAETALIVNTNSDGVEPGTFVGHKCGGTYVDNSVETAAHCFASDLPERGSSVLGRDTLTSAFNAFTITPSDRNGAVAAMIPRSQIVFETNLPQGNDLVGVTPGEPDSVNVQKRDGTLTLPLNPAAPAVSPLTMDQEVYVYPDAVSTKIFKGRVTGTFTGVNGVPAVVARFEPLGGENPLRAGASGSGVFVVESGEARLAAVVSGTFYHDDGTGVDGILSQDGVRRLADELYGPSYQPHRLSAMPTVSPAGELGHAKGFVPKNATPTKSGNTLFQTSRAHEPAVEPRRRKR